jgi:raffinose/stachyose/melibiose transport system substrate-binding protein
MKKIIALLVAMVFVVSMFAGCGKAPATESAVQETKTAVAEETKKEENKLSGKIVFATHMTNKVDTTLKDLAKQFTDSNPGTEIEIQGVKDTDKVVKVWMASNELPDITVCPNGVKQSTFKDYFLPLNDLGFNEDTLLFYKNGLGDDQQLYQVACSISLEGMLYNKKVFTDAGVTDIPKTQEELLAACEKIKAKGVVPVASLFKDKWPLGRWSEFGPAALSKNPNYLNDKTKSDELVADTWLDIYKLLRTMNEKGYLEKDLMSTNWDQFKKDFGAAKVGMVYLGTWLPPQIVENGGKIEEIGMFPLPGGQATANADNMYAVAKNSKNPELAKAFFKFLFAEPNFAKATGLTTSVKGVKSDDPIAAEILSYGQPLEMPALSEDYNALIGKAQIDREAMSQDLILAKDLDAKVKEYNQKWADARKALSK